MNASTISPALKDAREQARNKISGRFGEQTKTDPGTNLLTSAEPVWDTKYSKIDRSIRVELMETDLNAAIVALVESGQVQATLDRMTFGGLHRWSFTNQVLASFQIQARRHEMLTEDPHALDGVPEGYMAMTAKQWNDKYSRRPKAGSSAIWILAPRTVKKVDPDTGEEHVVIVGFRDQAEFDVSQTEGEPLPAELTYEFPRYDLDADVVPHLQSQVARAGYTYSEKALTGGPLTAHQTLGYTTADGTKQVVVDSRLDPASKASVLAHELAHIECGHVDDDYAEYRLHRGRMESEAEASAYMVKRALGLSAQESATFSAAYIAGWSQGNPDTIRRALNKAQKVYLRILGDLDHAS